MLLRCSLLMVGCGLVSITVLSQPRVSIFVDGELMGKTYNYRFDQQGNVLKAGVYNGCGLASIYGFGLNIRPSQQFAFEIGYSKVEMQLMVYDDKLIRANHIDPKPFDNYRGMISQDGNFDAAKLYNVGYSSVYYFFGPTWVVQPYVSAGIAWNSLDSRSTTLSGSYLYNATNENTAFVAHFKQKYVSKFFETGLSWRSYQRRRGRSSQPGPWNYFVGLRWTFGGQVMSGDYTNIGGPSDYADHVTASGSYCSFTARVGYTLNSPRYNSRKKHNASRKSSTRQKQKQDITPRTLERTTN